MYLCLLVSISVVFWVCLVFCISWSSGLDVLGLGCMSFGISIMESLSSSFEILIGCTRLQANVLSPLSLQIVLSSDILQVVTVRSITFFDSCVVLFFFACADVVPGSLFFFHQTEGFLC
jgi:hypothetical protein